jgi:hypothetical protein
VRNSFDEAAISYPSAARRIWAAPTRQVAQRFGVRPIGQRHSTRQDIAVDDWPRLADYAAGDTLQPGMHTAQRQR